MERFQQETPSDLAANYARYMAVNVWGEDLSAHTSAVLNTCGNCGQSAERLTFVDQFGIYECDVCMEDVPEVEDPGKPEGMCEERYQILCAATNVGAMHDALQVHKAECAQCGCTRKDVASDRSYIGEKAVA